MQDNAQTTLSFFELREQPFAATADPAYFFATRAHRECLFRLWNCIDERFGIAVILGNYGTGKTTLLRKILSNMREAPDKYLTAVVGSPAPSWTTFNLLEDIVGKFDLHPEERSYNAYMDGLNQFLVDNRDTVNTLVIDDAQNLNKRGQLELLRLIQNLETPQHKLLNVICFAQLEWQHILRGAPNFLQRISLSYTLEPIGVDEVRALIEYRLREAGSGPRGPVFDDGAIRSIYAYSGGSPRMIVTLCRNALVVAAQMRSRQIGQAIMLHTIQQTTLPDAEGEARLTETLAPQSRRTTSPKPPTQEPSAPPTSVESAPSNADEPLPTTLRARANELLLKAARSQKKTWKPPSDK